MSSFVEDEIWALRLTPNKTYSQNVQMPFRITMAALGQTISSQARSSVILRLDDTEYILCSLTPGKIEQQSLSQTIVSGENITLFTDGDNTIHLTGNFLIQEEGTSYDVDGDYSDDDGSFDENEYDEEDSFIDDASEEEETSKIEEISNETIVKERKNAIGESDSEKDPEINTTLQFKASEDETESETNGSEEESDGEDEESEGEFDSEEMGDSGYSSVEDSEEEISENVISAKIGDKRAAKPAEIPSKKNRDEEPKKISKGTQIPQNAEKQQKTSPSPKLDSTSKQAAGKKENSTTPKQQNNTPSKSQQNIQVTTPSKQEAPKNQGTPKKQDGEFKKITGGVEIKDIVASNSNKKARKGSKVQIMYKGMLSNGTVFDSNDEKNPLQFQLGKGQVIKGMEIGLEGMALNGTRIVKIPSALAYGKQKLPGIPPNSELTFQITLKRID